MELSSKKNFEKSKSLEYINLVIATREDIISVHIRIVPAAAQHFG